MLQRMRIAIRGYEVVEAIAYVFVYTHLQRDNLEPIIYTDAEQRAQEYASMLREQFKLDAKNIVVLKNQSK